MGVIFGQQRDQIRHVFVDVWRRRCEGTPLEPLERSIAAVIEAHPEYQPVMTDPEAIVRDYSVQSGETNPFLHMGMHITIIEQITCDRPSGIRALYDRLRASYHDTHELEHAMMQCLADCLWESRERSEPPDEQRYIACVRRLERRVL
jgi:hypothetical protein